MSSGGSNNDQMDQLRQMSQQVRTHAQQASDAINSQIDSMRDMVRNNSNLQSDQYVEYERNLRRQMKGMKDYYKANRRNLTKEDKHAYKVMYKNRRRDLRDLEREARNRFRDIEDSGTNAFENIGEKISEISESLRDWATAMNIDNIAGGLQDTANTILESKKILQQNTGLSKSDLNNLSKEYRQSSKDSGYITNVSEYMEIASQLAQMGYKDTEFLEEFGTSINNLSKAIGDIDLSNLDKFAEFANVAGSDQAIMYEQLAAAVSDNQKLYSSGQDIMNQFQANYDEVLYQSGGNIDKFNDIMKSRLAQFSLLNDNWMSGSMDSINQLFTDLQDATNTEAVQKLQAITGGGKAYQSIRDEALSGDYTNATKELILALKNNKNLTGDNAITTASALGLDTETLKQLQGKLNSEMYNITEESLNENIKNFNDSIIASIEGNPIEDAMNEAYISPLQKLKNWFDSTAIGQAVEQFTSDLGLSLTDMAVLGSVAGKALKGGGKLLSKLGGGAGGAGGGAGGGGSLLGGVANFFRAGFGGAGANTAAGAAGMNILGFGAPGGMATLGTGGLMSAGLLTTAATGVAGGVMLAKDAMGGVKKAKDWLGDDSTSSKVKAGIGGAIGGTGPGIFDENASVGDKAKNVLGNAGKGAALGATIGSIVPGLGTAIGGAVGAGVGAVAGAIGGEKISQAIDWVGDKAGAMWDGVKDTASSVWEGTKKFASNAWDKAKEFGINSFNTAVGVGDMAMDSLFSAVGLDWDETKQNISDGWNNIKETASEKWDGIKEKASEAWENTKKVAGEKWDSIKETAGSLWKGFTDKANEAWGGMKKIADSILGPIGDTLEGLWEGAKELAGNVADGVKSGWDKATGWLDDRWNDAKNFFSGAKDRGEKITKVTPDGSHESGLNYVPFDGYLAELHKGERVLTKEEAKNLKEGLNNLSGSKKIDISDNKKSIDKMKDYSSSTLDKVKAKGSVMYKTWTKYNKSLWDNYKKLGTSSISNLSRTTNNMLSQTSRGLINLFGSNSTIGKLMSNISKIGTGFSSRTTTGSSSVTSGGVGSAISKAINNAIGGNSNTKKPSTTGKNNSVGKIKTVEGSHKEGLDYVPKDGYIAELHKGERVLTKEESDKYSNSQNTKSVKSWFSGILKQISPTLQKPVIEAANNLNSTGEGSYPTVSAGDVEKSVWDFFTGLGYSKQSTAGILGNMYQESGGYTGHPDPACIQGRGKGPAAGIVQWENYNTKSSRWKMMADHANSNNRDWTDLQSQLEFIDMEMKGGAGTDSYPAQLLKRNIGGYDAFKSLTDINTATLEFEKAFEQAGNPVMQTRYNKANEYYNQFSAYKQGTPWVPDTQVALLHKGEAVIPAEKNPVNNGTKAELSSSNNSNNSTSESDVKEIVNVIKWMVGRLEKKLEETSQSKEGDTTNVYNSRSDKTRKSDEVFSF